MSKATRHAMTFVGVDGFAVPVSAKTTWVFIRVNFGDGGHGWGEATHFGSEVELSHLVTGLNATLRIAPAVGLLEAQTSLRQAYLSPGRRALLSALEQAYFDGQGRRAGQSVAAQFGGPARDAVPFYANINRGIADRSAAGFAAQTGKILATTGAQAVKIAPFDGIRWDTTPPADITALIDQGLARVAAVRDALPDRAQLMVDCHGRFDLAMARTVIKELAASSVYWVEEPCQMDALTAQDQRSLRAFAHANDMLLAGGEELTNTGEMLSLLNADGHDVVLPDLRLTGLLGGIAMLDLAAHRQVRVSIHNPVGPVLDAMSIQIAASLPSFLILERQIGETPLFDKIRTTPHIITDGAVALLDEPGIGFAPLTTSMSPLADAAAAPMSFAGHAGAGPDA